MAKPKSTIPTETLSVTLPTALLDRVRLRLIDPATGVVRYGLMKRTVVEALTEWEVKRSALSEADPKYRKRPRDLAGLRAKAQDAVKELNRGR